MKSYFTKQVQTYCNFTFKNKIFKQNQQHPQFRTSKIQQREHKIKQEKISLKKINSQQTISLRKRLNHSPSAKLNKLSQRESSIKKIPQINKKNLGSAVQNSQNIFIYEPQLKQISLTKSLPKDLNRKCGQKRNLIKQLKQYKMRKQSKVNFPINQFQIANFNSMGNSKQYSPPHQLNFRKGVVTTHQLQKNSQQIGLFTPNSKQLFTNNFNFQYTDSHKQYQSNLNSQFQPLYIKKIQSQKLIQLNIPYQPSQFNRSTVTREDQFMKQVYNDYDIDDQIKLDLISSIKANKHQMSIFKPEESMKSTMISPSQMKYIKYQPSINFSTPTSGFRRNYDYDVYDPNNRQFNSKSNGKRDKLDDKKIINRRERFKSIVSVHSQHDSQQQSMKDSVVLETHNDLRLSGRVTKLI